MLYEDISSTTKGLLHELINDDYRESQAYDLIQQLRETNLKKDKTDAPKSKQRFKQLEKRLNEFTESDVDLMVNKLWHRYYEDDEQGMDPEILFEQATKDANQLINTFKYCCEEPYFITGALLARDVIKNQLPNILGVTNRKLHKTELSKSSDAAEILSVIYKEAGLSGNLDTSYKMLQRTFLTK